MIKDLIYYFCKEVKPRIIKVIFADDLFISVIIAIILLHFENKITILNPKKTAEFLQGLISYSSIALGFCLAGMTIIFTIPNEQFKLRLKTNHVSASKPNSFSNLLFIFSWTAICHLLSIIVLILLFIFQGQCFHIFCIDCELVHKIVFVFTSVLIAYCVFQFLITIVTLSRLGTLYINSISDKNVQ